MSYRDDPAWQQAQADYVDEDAPITANERMAKRAAAIRVMHDIECQYPPRERFEPHHD